MAQDDYDRARRTFDAVVANPLAASRIRHCEHEVTFLADGDPDAKARADLYHAGIRYIGDLKTTGDPRALGNEDAIAKLVNDRDWHLQLAWYRHCAFLCGAEIERVEIIVATTKPPHVCEVVALDEAFLDLGAQRWAAALERMRWHQRNPEAWPGPSCDSDGQPCVRIIGPPRRAKSTGLIHRAA